MSKKKTKTSGWKAEAVTRVKELIAKGSTSKAALEQVGITPGNYYRWCKGSTGKTRPVATAPTVRSNTESTDEKFALLVRQMVRESVKESLASLFT